MTELLVYLLEQAVPALNDLECVDDGTTSWDFRYWIEDSGHFEATVIEEEDHDHPCISAVYEVVIQPVSYHPFRWRVDWWGEKTVSRILVRE